MNHLKMNFSVHEKLHHYSCPSWDTHFEKDVHVRQREDGKKKNSKRLWVVIEGTNLLHVSKRGLQDKYAQTTLLRKGCEEAG